MEPLPIDRKTAIRAGDTIYLLNPKEIMYCSSLGHTTRISKAQGGVLDLPVSIDELEKHLVLFFRIHKDYLINLEFLGNVSETGNGYVVVGETHKLPIDNHKVKILINALSYLSE